MDKKKIIGTIIGVIAFAAIIAGATYAYLTATITFNQNNVTGKALNFIVDYTKGTDINGVLILDSNSVATTSMTSASSGKLSIKASRTSTSSDGDLQIRLITTSSNALVQTSGTHVLHYAVCNGTCTLTGTAATSPTSSTTGLLAKGTISSTTQTLVTINGISTSAITYDVYLWVDQADFYANTDTFNGLTYSGYVDAYATQD